MTDTFRARLLAQHLKLAFRVLRNAPAFSALVIAILALGIGANTAVFSVIDAVLLRQLPYGDPNRLVVVWEKNHALGTPIGERVPVSHANSRGDLIAQADENCFQRGKFPLNPRDRVMRLTKEDYR